jgi:hypothetical protein
MSVQSSACLRLLTRAAEAFTSQQHVLMSM